MPRVGWQLRALDTRRKTWYTRPVWRGYVLRLALRQILGAVVSF
jgi:hypothetical protein